MFATNLQYVKRAAESASRPPLFLRSFKWLLLGYALFGRTFAYMGVAPLFVGEIFLLWGCLRAPIARALAKLTANPTFILLALFIFGCAIRSVFNLQHYLVADVLRDGAIWGYGIFAIIVASYCVLNSQVIPSALETYSRFGGWYVLWGPLVYLVGYVFSDVLPMLPGTNVAAIEQKPADVQVHLAGIVAFAYLGFRRFTLLQLCLVIVAMLVLGSLNRGGFLAFLCAMTLICLFKPRFKFILSIVGAAIVAIAVFTFFDFNVRLFGRSISPAQIGQNFLSIFGGSNSGDLNNTRMWRIEWWNQIVQYTIHGDYFWTGKGFGINLANDDGFQVDADFEKLRSPHNSHLTFLARGGVPIFALWILLQLSWAIAMVRLVFHARARRETLWENLTIFLLAYWTAMIVNMNFDVYLEGPMGGIWFWTIFGYGLAVQWLYRYRPRSLAALSVPNLR